MKKEQKPKNEALLKKEERKNDELINPAAHDQDFLNSKFLFFS